MSEKIEIVDWTPFALYKYDIDTTDDNCSICRNSFLTICIECDTIHADPLDHLTTESQSNTTTTCTITKGLCGHAFHSHCIDKWTKKCSVCPLCNTPYKQQVRNMNDTSSLKKILEKHGF